MTEDQKAKLKADIFGEEEIPKEFEIAYLQQQIKDHVMESNKIMANFLMFSDTNNDEGMTNCGSGMRTMRDRLAYFRKRLAELTNVD